MVIAIDGPAGAGKSSVARMLASRLGFTYLDTGAMYRCVALAWLRRHGDPGEIAASLQIGLGERITLDGEDVTDLLRVPDVSEAASRLAEQSVVRSSMVAHQRRLLEDGNWVAEGRDIGTVVRPDAELKIFLTASPQERARRRAAELGVDPARILAEQTLRDERDRTRADSPLRRAQDAIELDTTALSLDAVVARLVALLPAG